jgi:hypothetical protein
VVLFQDPNTIRMHIFKIEKGIPILLSETCAIPA